LKLHYIAGTLAVLALAAAALVYSGVYDVAANDQHLWPTYWTLRAAMERSIAVRARHIALPELDDAQRLRRGVGIYRDNCAQCHGAPGVAPEPFALGMLPVPENLALIARQRATADIYWTVRNGLKMTGMPAWQYRLSDEEMWDVVAFVKKLPSFSPAQYAALKPMPTAPANDENDPADAQRGKKALEQYACVTCHEIPWVVGSNSPVGPPLAHIAKRTFIAGVLPNTTENMTRWLIAPQEVKPGTAMPDLHMRVRDAKDIAAYLATLD
jgi:mono/diheme cytochrome c family protein